MHQRSRRPAVTLMEVLVVIAIIGILFGLTMAVVMNVRPTGTRLETQIEIQRLDGKLREFAVTYGFYPSSQIRLCERLSDYKPQTSLVDARSLEALNQMFGKDVWNSGTIDWDGDGAYSPPVMLTGDQCLVFFLGGIPEQTTPGVRGFAAAGNPAATRGAPLFNFKRERLVKVRGNNFYSYLDPYGKQPYAYFSSSKWGYNAWTTLPAPAFPSDCPAMSGTNVSPYLSAKGTFHMPDSFQIISAGKDGVFGPGGNTLTPGGGASLPPPAQDDLTSFSGGILRGYP